ncbi:DUF221-domain-containing protein [Hortaea werneckii]|nr:DUF221-domain-containing protein [Hortaea werneckii]
MVSDHGSHRSGSTSGAAILAALIPTLVTAIIYVAIFANIRNNYRKIYAPRTFLGTIDEKDRTPAERADGRHWFHDFRQLTDTFVLQHNSLEAFLYLRYLRSIVWICLIGCLLTWPILFPINANGGGTASQLDRISFSNVTKNHLLWAHVAIAWVFFLGIMVFLAWERLRLIGIRQAYFLDNDYASRLSARTVLWLNAPREACQQENMKEYFGEDAEKLWAVRDLGDLDGLIAQRNGTAYSLERAEMDLVIMAVQLQKMQGSTPAGLNGQAEGQQAVPTAKRPTKREPPLVGKKVDILDKTRKKIGDLNKAIETHRSAPSRNVPEQSAVFVSFNSQPAAHRAYQQISFQPRLPVQDRFLAPQPKEVLWKNVVMPKAERLSKGSMALAFVIVFTIFFSIPTGLIGTISNVKYLADRVSWLAWIDNLPPWALGLLTGLLPPFLVSWFVSYVPKLFRHVAKLSGEPTTSQAELKTQAWYFAFQVVQIFLVTTFSSGAAAVATQIAKDPKSTPDLLAESLPKASNFYLTYFLLQGLTKASDDLLNYSDLFTYLFYEKFWNKTPREHFNTHADMKGTPWASWFPKFTNLFVIAIVYACIAPLVLGFATVGIFIYSLSYRYNLLYVCQSKVDTKGEAYKRALQQVPTGIYLAELCLIGLMGARKAAIQTTLMIVLLVLTAVINLILDRTIKPLEIYLGVDIWQEQEVPLLAEEDGIDPNDEAALHGASHARRLGLKKLPNPAPRILSDFFDGIISAARAQAKGWLSDLSLARRGDAAPLKDEDLAKAYLAPALTAGIPKLWIPSDKVGMARQEAELNEAAGMPTTTEAAEIDDEGKLHWDQDFERVPIWKKTQSI